MTYLTLEVEISDGKVVAKEPGKMPEKGMGFLTILQSSAEEIPSTTPLRALEALQQYLKLNERGATKWMAMVRDARR